MPPHALARRLDAPASPDHEPISTGPFPRPIPDAELTRANRKADYQHIFTRLTDALDRFREHTVFHQIEAIVVADQCRDGERLLPYVADVAHWCHTIEQLMEPEQSAAPKPATWYRGRP
jgi:hypothetical protein